MGVADEYLPALLRRAAGAGLAAFIAPAGFAEAGFVISPDSLQIISSSSVGGFSRSFDASGRLKRAATFSKLSLETLAEQGYTPDLMFLARIGREEDRPKYLDDPGFARRWTVMAGARQVIVRHEGWALSAQGMAGFGMGLDRSAFVGDARLLLARNLALGPFPGFVEIQAGYRHGGGIERSEFRLDKTLGVEAAPDVLALIQLFSAHAPRRDGLQASWRVKAALGLVWRMNDRWSVQIGGFTTLHGRNAAFEQGGMLAVWRRF